jgi:hypothetical protein
MGSYVSQPLTVRCEGLAEIRRFLAGCTYISDQKQFNEKDYWLPPEEFEKRKQGDCDCFALWTWRQFLELGYQARYVVGRHGSLGCGHAWVMFQEEGDWYLAEPTAARLGDSIPRLWTLANQPIMSTSWDGERLRYFEHKNTGYVPSTQEYCRLLAEAAWFRIQREPRWSLRRTGRWLRSGAEGGKAAPGHVWKKLARRKRSVR